MQTDIVIEEPADIVLVSDLTANHKLTVVSVSQLTKKGSFPFYDFDGPVVFGNILEFSDAGGGQVEVRSPRHGLSNGTSINIEGTSNYNGGFTATNVSADTFEITDTFAGDDATGTWTVGDKVGLKRGDMVRLLSSGANNHNRVLTINSVDASNVYLEETHELLAGDGAVEFDFEFIRRKE